MKIVIYTLGCKVNQYESDSIQLALENRGFEVSNKLEKADVFIVNTCAVTNEAERKSRQVISKFEKLNSDAQIFICGCASEKDSNKFKDLKNVKFISGVANKVKIVDELEKIIDTKQSDKKPKIDIEKISDEYSDNYFSKPTKTRAFVKIQDGCNNFCSYCIIPYLRGRSRSRNIIDILNEVQNFGNDIKEIVLTGIDISDYKIDGELALGRLVNELSNYNIRIRLGSLEQGIITDEFIDGLSKIRNLCPHFHLSLQSGSDTVLKRMNRHYNQKDFLKSIKKLRKIFVNPAITTDVIVGFPGETEKEFKETCKFIKKAKFASLHIFPYSKREGTIAARFKDLDGKVKKERVARLEKINNKLKADYIRLSKKTLHSVLIEEKEGEYFIGHSENYIKCFIKNENLLVNSFVNVKIKKKYLDGALAEVCK
jgi:threonylcarbamoyladenosine tRNA methylthiotransferase MtaB